MLISKSIKCVDVHIWRLILLCSCSCCCCCCVNASRHARTCGYPDQVVAARLFPTCIFVVILFVVITTAIVIWFTVFDCLFFSFIVLCERVTNDISNTTTMIKYKFNRMKCNWNKNWPLESMHTCTNTTMCRCEGRTAWGQRKGSNERQREYKSNKGMNGMWVKFRKTYLNHRKCVQRLVWEFLTNLLIFLIHLYSCLFH